MARRATVGYCGRRQGTVCVGRLFSAATSQRGAECWCAPLIACLLVSSFGIGTYLFPNGIRAEAGSLAGQGDGSGVDEDDDGDSDEGGNSSDEHEYEEEDDDDDSGGGGGGGGGGEQGNGGGECCIANDPHPVLPLRRNAFDFLSPRRPALAICSNTTVSPSVCFDHFRPPAIYGKGKTSDKLSPKSWFWGAGRLFSHAERNEPLAVVRCQ